MASDGGARVNSLLSLGPCSVSETLWFNAPKCCVRGSGCAKLTIAPCSAMPLVDSLTVAAARAVSRPLRSHHSLPDDSTSETLRTPDSPASSRPEKPPSLHPVPRMHAPPRPMECEAVDSARSSCVRSDAATRVRRHVKQIEFRQYASRVGHLVRRERIVSTLSSHCIARARATEAARRSASNVLLDFVSFKRAVRLATSAR